MKLLVTNGCKPRSIRADAGRQASNVGWNAAINKLVSCIAVVAVSASTLHPCPRTCVHTDEGIREP